MSEEEPEWRALVDPRSKKVYYVNMLTRKTTWTNPHAPQTEEWVQYTDSKGRNYYMNKISRKSTWTQPDGFEEDSLEWATAKQKKKTGEKKKGWTKYVDPRNKQPYWIDENGSMSTIDPNMKDEQAKETSSDTTTTTTTETVQQTQLADDEEEVWTVPLTVKHADGTTQKAKISALMDKIEGGVVKDISEIKDFSAKKLSEYLRAIQTIVSRKRTSYFIEKNLEYIEEIVDRKDASVMKHFSSSRNVSTMMSILSLPRKASTVEVLLRVLLKTVRISEKFASKLRLETRFWDCVFNCVSLASGNDDAIRFSETFTHDEARDIPTPRHSSKSEVDTYKKNVSNQLGKQHSEQDSKNLSECAHYSLELLEVYMEDPLILNFAREYRAVNDIVECSRSHEARISIIAGKVLLKLVEKKTKLRQLVDGSYSLNELLAMGVGRVSEAAMAALEEIVTRVSASSILSLDLLPGENTYLLRSGLTLGGKAFTRFCDPFEVVAAIQNRYLYLYRNDKTPILKLGLQNVKFDTSKNEIQLSFEDIKGKGHCVELTLNNENAESKAFCDRIRAETKIRTMAPLRPVSSFGAPVLESLRVHTRRKRDERRRRKEQERLSRKSEKGTDVMLSAAPSKKKNKKKPLSRTKSRLRQPEGPGSSIPCPEFDGSIALATEKSVQGRIWNAAIPSGSTFDWADLACAIPTLLVMARKCAGIESLVQKTILGLDICTLALSSCDTMRFEARRSVLAEDEYGFADVIIAIISSATKNDEDEKVDERVLQSVANLILVALDLESGNKSDDAAKKSFMKALNKSQADGVESFLYSLLSGSQAKTVLCGLRFASVVEETISLSRKARDQVKVDYERALNNVTDENMRRAMLLFVSTRGKKSSSPSRPRATSSSSGDKKCVVM